MEDAENAFNDGIAKMQEALEMVKENCNDVFGLKEEIEELETQAGELEGAGDEINEELKVKFLIKIYPAVSRFEIIKDETLKILFSISLIDRCVNLS